MKPKKTYKSLTELSADSIGVINAETEKTKPPKPHVPNEAASKIPREDSSHIYAAPGYHRWGINE